MKHPTELLTYVELVSPPNTNARPSASWATEPPSPLSSRVVNKGSHAPFTLVWHCCGFCNKGKGCIAVAMQWAKEGSYRLIITPTRDWPPFSIMKGKQPICTKGQIGAALPCSRRRFNVNQLHGALWMDKHSNSTNTLWKPKYFSSFQAIK